MAITRWFAQRVTSPLTGETLTSTALVPEKALRAEIASAAKDRLETEEGTSFFACPFCGEESCGSRSVCRTKYERQLRSDAAFGAAARRRRWIEGNVLPSAERALRSGPIGAGALMLGAFSVGAVGAIVGGVASSLTEVATGGAEIARGVAEAAQSAAQSASRAAFPPPPRENGDGEEEDDDEDDAAEHSRASWSRGCFKIASGAVLVPVASASIAAMFAVGAAAGSVALATGILTEIGSSFVSALRLTANAIAGETSQAAHDASPPPANNGVVDNEPNNGLVLAGPAL